MGMDRREKVRPQEHIVCAQTLMECVAFYLLMCYVYLPSNVLCLSSEKTKFLEMEAFPQFICSSYHMALYMISSYQHKLIEENE